MYGVVMGVYCVDVFVWCMNIYGVLMDDDEYVDLWCVNVGVHVDL